MFSSHFLLITKQYLLSSIFLLFSLPRFTPDARSFSLKEGLSNTNPKDEAYDCPDLAINFGDACDDGNAATQNDVITTDCICAGTFAPPANDLIENAQVLTLNLVDTLILGTTFGASDELGPFECDSTNGPWPDVFYTFNSGDYTYILVNINLITQADFILSVSEDGEEGELAFCTTGSGFSLLNKQTDYIVRVAPASGFEGSGEFSISLNANHLCPDLNMDPGDPCYTYMGAPGYLGNTCECEPVITNCSNPFYGGTVALSNSNNEIYYGPFQQKHYLYFTNATAGAEYTITSTLGDTPGFITVRADGSSGVIGAGYSPLTITSPITGTLRVDLNLDEYCSVANTIYYDLTAQCTSCEFNCPEIPGNHGDACDDGNPNTTNDTIDMDCNCTGEYEAGSLAVTANWNSNCNERELSIKLYAPNDTTMLYSFTTFLNGDATIILSDDIAAGSYDIYAKIDGYLAKGFFNESISNGNNTLILGSFKPGDLNNDNFVNIVDASILNLSFGLVEGDSNFNYLADSNCDGYINFTDASTQFAFFNETGAQP